MTYIAEIDEPAPDTLCTCGDCEWSGPFSALEEIEDCSLTPGDPSPAGRCPVCGTLAYIAAPSALALAAERMRALLAEAIAYEQAQFDGDPETDLNVSGADLVDWFTQWREQAKEELQP